MLSTSSVARSQSALEVLPSSGTTPHTIAAEIDAVLLLEVDIAKPISSVIFIDLQNGRRYTRGLLLVRMHTRPIGLVALESNNFQITPYEVADFIWAELSQEINEALAQDGLPRIEKLDAFGLPYTYQPEYLRERDLLKQTAPMASIIVCTHDRPDQISLCLDSLLRLDYPGGFEIIVVDNAPSSEATKYLITHDYFDDVHYLREDRPGISHARNRGLEVAVGEIVAFTDDDAIVEPNWLTELLRGFKSGENVACVTGLTLPSELETPAQIWFQQERGGKRGFKPALFDLKKHRPRDPLYPFRAPIFGAGMNMAFKTSVLRQLGGFDTALGIGTATHSGEDMAAYFEVILRGYQLAYEPGAMVYHNHRDTYSELRDQIYGNGVGCAAYLTRCLKENPRLLFRLLSKLPAGLVASITQRSEKKRLMQTKFWLELKLLEWWGFAHGPLAYYRTQRQSTT
ncbi:MAG: glycosyltransferase [Chitinophagaceae bacterium]|nr:glycosyltransferase [Anaerolineae bacterium]